MIDPDISRELLKLQEQIAALTRRIYSLEQRLQMTAAPISAAPAAAIPPPQPIAVPQAPPLPTVEIPQPEITPKAFDAIIPPQPHIPAIFAAPPPEPVVSLESRIGGQWLNRIGIVAVLVGLSYFLKLAIENNWIGPPTRIIIGLVAGSGIVVWSELFRRRGFAGFAYSLKAVGIGALYLSLWAAFQFYHLIPATLAFFAMVLVTAGSAAMSLRQDSELLAAFALLGGFLTPILVSTGENHEVTLFSYVVLLDLGAAWMVAIKRWPRLLFGSFAGTVLLFAAWASSYYADNNTVITLGFAALFFLLYAGLALRDRTQLLAALALAAAYLVPLMLGVSSPYALALLLYLLLLSVATLWLITRSGWRALLFGSFAGTLIVFGEWAIFQYNQQRLGTTLLFASILFLLYLASLFLVRFATDETRLLYPAVAMTLLNASSYFAACYALLWPANKLELLWIALTAMVLYFAAARLLRALEITGFHLFEPLYIALAVCFLTAAVPIWFGGIWLDLCWLVEGGALFWATHRAGSLLLRGMGASVLTLGVLHLILIDSTERQPLLLNPRFALYLVAIAALALLAYFAIQEGESGKPWAGAAIIGINLLALIALHCEVLDYFQPASGQRLASDAWHSAFIARNFTYSAVWMTYGAGLMLIGFWKRSAFVRWQAIVLLALTTMKVFFYDINELDRGYRIGAFLVLGVILLAVSFFYQRSRSKAAA